MRKNRYLISSLLFVAAFQLQFASAQEIKGDTIYTSVVSPTILHFPTNITSCVYSDPAADSRFHAIVITSAVAIRAKTATAKSAILKVSEGNRSHSFVLVFKSKLAPGELAHQWSSEETLKEYVKSHEDKKGRVEVTNQSQKPLTGKLKDSVSADVVNKDITSDDYKAMFMQSNALEEKRDFAEAKKLFNRATALKEKKYQEQITAANQALIAKDFEEANARFTLALDIKPDDASAKKWLSTSQMKMDSVGEYRKKDNDYDSIISKANAAIALLDYTNAKRYFKEAQLLKPDESVPGNMLKYIESAARNLAERQRINDSVQRVVKTRETLEKANREVLAKNWISAMTLYKEVLVLDPTAEQEDFAKKKIETINLEFERLARQSKSNGQIALVNPPDTKISNNDEKKIEKPSPAVMKPQEAANNAAVQFPGTEEKIVSKKLSKTPQEEEEQKRKDQERIFKRKLQINEWMDKAQQAFLNKDWDSAKAFYQFAIGLYPSREREIYAKKRIEEIDQERQNAASQPAIANGATIVTSPNNNARTGNQDNSVESTAKNNKSVSETISKTTNKPLIKDSVKNIGKSRIPDSAKAVENKVLARQAQINNAINKAQNAFALKNWDSAKAYYQEVLAFQPSKAEEEFIKQSIEAVEIGKTAYLKSAAKEPIAITTQKNNAEVPSKKVIASSPDSAINLKKEEEAKLAQELLIKQKLLRSEWLGKAQIAFFARKYDSAKTYFEKVIASHPSAEQEEFAKKKLEAINIETSKVVSAANVSKKPDVISPALNNSEIPSKTISTSGTSDSSGKVQKGLYVDSLRIAKEKDDEKRKEQERIFNRKIEINRWMDKAQQAYSEKNLDSARTFYLHAIALYPSREREAYAKKKIEEIDLEIQRARNSASVQKELTNTFPANNNTKTAVKEAEDTKAKADTILSKEVPLAKSQKNLQTDTTDKTVKNKGTDLVNSQKVEDALKNKIPFNGVNAKRDNNQNSVPQKEIAPTTSVISPEIPVKNINALSAADLNKNAQITLDSIKIVKQQEEEERLKQERILKHKLQISEWMDKGQQAFLTKNWDSAKSFYNRAISLVPPRDREAFAKKKLEEIDLEMQKTESQMDTTNAVTISLPSSSETATVTGKEAKADLEIPLKPIKIILTDTAKPSVKNAKPDLATTTTNPDPEKNQIEIVALINMAELALQSKNWEKAKGYYRRILALEPSATQKGIAKNKLAAIDLQLQKATIPPPLPKAMASSRKNNSETTSDEPFAKTKPANSMITNDSVVRIGMISNQKVIPNSNNKNVGTPSQNPGITEGVEPPVNQALKPLANRSESENKNEYSEASEIILRLAPRLALADSNNSIKMVCQDISFSGKNAYIKLMIQNKSSDLDFSSDSLHVLYIKNYGILKKLKPRYLSAVPNVLPGKESQIVYVTEAYSDVEPNEIFILEVEDKLKRSKLTIHIRGDVYNQLKTK